MTPKERAAMQQALEYMEGTKTVFTEDEELDEAITALREALAEKAEQEPVAWWNGKIDDNWVVSKNPAVFLGQIPLYAAPVRTKDLTDDELCKVITKTPVTSALELYRAVIAADREKNK